MKQPSRPEKLPLKCLRAKLFYMFAVTLPSQLQSKDDRKGLDYPPTTDLGSSQESFKHSFRNLKLTFFHLKAIF